MTVLRIVLLFACYAAGLLSALAQTEPVHDSPARKPVTVEEIASYPFARPNDLETKRIVEIFVSHHIRYSLPNSSEVSVMVFSDQAAEARLLLAQAILKEHLRLTLTKWSPIQGKYIIVDPKEDVGPSPPP